jgi:hypothetical protein
MQSSASTVSEYISSLSVPDRKVVREMRAFIRKQLPMGYVERMQYGMITYVVPLRIYPKGYGGNPEVPLPYLSLAAQKEYFALYLMSIYGDPEAGKALRDSFAKSGKRLEMGKSCLRFRSMDDLELHAVSRAIAHLTPREFADRYTSMRKKKE